MVGLGVDLQDLPRYVGHNDLGTAVLLAAMDRAGIGRLVLASSMVSTARAATCAPSTGRCVPGRVRRRTSPRGASSRAARSARHR
jgi:dTDP-L-rhamnose 4-epimerase